MGVEGGGERTFSSNPAQATSSGKEYLCLWSVQKEQVTGKFGRELGAQLRQPTHGVGLSLAYLKFRRRLVLQNGTRRAFRGLRVEKQAALPSWVHGPVSRRKPLVVSVACALL